MRFGLLGPLACWTADGTPVRVPEAKVRVLLAALLLQEGRPVSTDRLVEDLWGVEPPGNPANTLQTKVSQLRRALDAAEPGARRLIAHAPPGYALEVDADAVDVGRFRALLADARRTPDPRARVATLSDALALWRGPVAADLADEPFVVAAAARLEEERLAAREDLADARLELGEHSLLVGELADLVAEHPLRERPRALWMRALYAAGRQAEALSAYADLRDRLVDELGLEPGPEISALHQAILEQDPDLAGPPAPRASALGRRTNLPAPVSALIGREAAVKELVGLVGDTGSFDGAGSVGAGSGAGPDAPRLVTLTGPGGVGKTRLAIEVARELADELPDGVWLAELGGIDRLVCPLSSCSDDDWVVEHLAGVLGVSLNQQGSTDPPAPIEVVAEAIAAKRLLLVVDNCEPVVRPVASALARLLRGVPGLRVLATSQEPLDIDGETRWPVPPLGLPSEPGTAADAESVVESEAVRLFVARVRESAPDFVLDAETAPVVAAICRRLDGVPLALELAATRVRALGPREVLDRLSDRFAVLTAGRRDAPARHQTLRATIDWSWSLLSEAEQAALRRLAVHADGWTIENAEAVVAGGAVRRDDVLDLVARLADRSLVVARDDALVGRRYRLLESVTAYARERLTEADELADVRRRHAEHFVALAGRADARLRGPDQRRWLDRMDADADNLRAAFETAIELGDAELALRAVTALTWYWFLRGRLREARRASRRALALVDGAGAEPVELTEQVELAAYPRAMAAGLAVLDGEPHEPGTRSLADAVPDPAARACARWFLGYAVGTVGDLPAAAELTTEALRDYRALGDEWGIAAALCDRANQRVATGDLEGARRDADEAAARWTELGDRWGQLQASFVLGMLAQLVGDYDEALRLHQQSLHRAEELGLWAEVSYQLSWIGRLALLRGEFERADEFHGRAMRLAAERGFVPAEMYAATGLALAARRAGRLDEADRLLTRILSWHRGVDEAGATLILAERGFVAELRGEAEAARTLHAKGLAIARRGGDPRAIALGLEGLAGATALAGEPAEAAGLLGAASRWRASVGVPLPEAERGDIDRIAASIRRDIDETAYAAAYAAGAAPPRAEQLAGAPLPRAK